MESERNEVYERIPWETLDRGGGDRQWLVIAVAGAIAVGAVAFSFMRGQPVPPPASAPIAEPAPAPAPTAPVESVPTTVSSPLVVAEADLYAVDTDHLADLAAAHAEWFAVEYLSVDGSDQSRQVLASLLPSGIPLPEASQGTQVFVDWAGAQAVTETAPLTYQVEVVVRSLVDRGEGGFTRQPATRMEVVVAVGEDGLPRVVRPPRLIETPPSSPAEMALTPVPEAVKSQVESTHGTVVGGVAQPDGTWLVVALVTGADQVTRPVTVIVP
ncbi:MAG: hypothetical protein ACRDVL_01315 [Acidimicrobiia bacterium]